MRRISVYLFARTAIASVSILAVLTAIIWVTQALRRFDLVTAKGQALLSYLSMTLLAVPFLISIAAPFALAIGMIVVLNSAHADSELVAMNAAGASHRQILRPFLLLAVLTGLLVTFIAAWGAPKSLQLLRDYTTAVRADVLTNIAQPGRFMEVDENFVFHIRNRAPDGSVEGLFIYDSRRPDITFTYTAERGRFVEALGKTLMVMENGTIERIKHPGEASTFVAFGSYAFDLSSLQPEGGEVSYKVNELTIDQLLALTPDDPLMKSNADEVASEIHSRLASFFYPMAMVLAVFFFLGFPMTTRDGRVMTITLALLFATIVRLLGFAASGVASNDIRLLPLVYAVPIVLLVGLGAIVALRTKSFTFGSLEGAIADGVARFFPGKASSGGGMQP
ncbi:lipopolysaccharide ABC transporter permease [Hartmannibacter diazotrophicus]|uniref:Lipopolysaccharide ABC transporter permease n=1 Tax=Hartmannibacter diazotrophicus TaxID=1482074 RepID=A0A2C9D6L1_9HYPH|nr:LptF/LptG family permease [Hartmannibacter diazotrophicus]SON55964.1 lipopolysaccharide ABC transporter permease [Hartmannibacter diazotrophicus]